MNHIDKYTNEKALQALAEHITASQADCVMESNITNRELSVVCRKSQIIPFLKFLRDDSECQFKMLVDICGVDWPQRERRFDVVYHLLSISKNLRIRVKARVAEGDSIASATEVFSAANWYEREAYDMFGIPFDNHPDLRRILTDYDFDGFPLRKDFPLAGHVEVYYDSDSKRVAQKPVDLPQEFRNFDKQSPWQGMTGNVNQSAAESSFNADEFGLNGDK